MVPCYQILNISSYNVKMYHIKAKKRSFPIHTFVYFVLFCFLYYNRTYHNVSNIATIFWVTVIVMFQFHLLVLLYSTVLRSNFLSWLHSFQSYLYKPIMYDRVHILTKLPFPLQTSSLPFFVNSGLTLELTPYSVTLSIWSKDSAIVRGCNTVEAKSYSSP